MLRRLRSFPVCGQKGMALFSGSRTWFWFHAGRGTTPGVFGNRALTFFERGRIPHTRGRKSGLRALNECCYGVRTLWKICRVWSESRPAKKRAPAKRRGPVHHGVRRERAPLLQELPPKLANLK